METITAMRQGQPADAAADVQLKAAVEDLYTRYAECIADDALEQWPDFFTDECLYQIIPRANRDRGLPIAIMLAESRGGLVDRVVAIRNTMVFSPRSILLSITGVRVVDQAAGIVRARSTFTVYQTLVDEVSSLLMVGRSFDRIDTSGAEWKFIERVAVYDSDILPATVIYPV